MVGCANPLPSPSARRTELISGTVVIWGIGRAQRNTRPHLPYAPCPPAGQGVRQSHGRPAEKGGERVEGQILLLQTRSLALRSTRVTQGKSQGSSARRPSPQSPLGDCPGPGGAYFGTRVQTPLLGGPPHLGAMFPGHSSSPISTSAALWDRQTDRDG